MGLCGLVSAAPVHPFPTANTNHKNESHHMTDTNTADTFAMPEGFIEPTSQTDFNALSVEHQSAMFQRLEWNESRAREENAARADAAVNEVARGGLGAGVSAAPSSSYVHVNDLSPAAINAMSDGELMAKLTADLHAPARVENSRITANSAGTWGKLPPITFFSPAEQESIQSLRTASNTQEDAIRHYMEGRSSEYRRNYGAGVRYTNAFQREAIDLNIELEGLKRDHARRIEAMNEISHYDRDGNVVYVMSDHGRRMAQNEADRLHYQMRLLTVIEAPKKLRAAKQKAFDDLRSRAAAHTEKAEAQAMAETIMREDRIRAEAERIAKSKRNNF